MKFTLLENALDSLSQGVELALNHQDSRSKLKVAILLVAQAVELVLKERLRREHWCLIYRKVETAGAPEAFTVTADEAIKRLRQIANVSLTEDEKSAVKNLQKIRNSIQHHKVELSFEQAVGPINAAIAFLIRFLHEELETDIRDLLDEANQQRLLDIGAAYEELRKVANVRILKLREAYQPARPKDQLGWHFEVIECPACAEEFYVFSVDEHISKCQLCGHEAGFVSCSHCGQVFPSGASELGYEFEDDPYVVCEYCMYRLVEE